MMESPPLQEFNKILQVLEARGQQRPGQRPAPPILAMASRCIWKSDPKTSKLSYPCSVYTLSPSDASIIVAQRHIADLLPRPGTTKLRLPALTPNHAAVVLWVDLGEPFILLGSDLEEMGYQDRGWSAILGSRTYPVGKASIFKIPHHGSSTAPRFFYCGPSTSMAGHVGCRAVGYSNPICSWKRITPYADRH
jgi:hypothetical protein